MRWRRGKVQFSEMPSRAQDIACALSKVGARVDNHTALVMDQALTEQPDADPYTVLKAVVVALGVLPGVKDNWRGGLMHRDADVAAFIVRHLADMATVLRHLNTTWGST